MDEGGVPDDLEEGWVVDASRLQVKELSYCRSTNMSTLPNELVTDRWPIWSNCNPGVMICGASWRILLHIFSIFFRCSILRQRCWPGVVHQVNILLPHLSNSSTRDNISPFPTFFSSKTWTLSWVHTKNTLKHIIYIWESQSGVGVDWGLFQTPDCFLVIATFIIIITVTLFCYRHIVILVSLSSSSF